MYKTMNILFLILIFFFSFHIYKYYSSNKNLQAKDFNRININQIINEKIINIPVLPNDTNNVIEFNNSISDAIKNNKERSFWNLLKSK